MECCQPCVAFFSFWCAGTVIRKIPCRTSRLERRTATEIDNYLAVRLALQPADTNPFLLPGRGEKPLSANRLYPLFHQAVKDIGPAGPRRIIANLTFGAPTPHCLTQLCEIR